MTWILIGADLVLLTILIQIRTMVIGIDKLLTTQKLMAVAIAEIHQDIHTMRTRQQNDAEKIRLIKEFCDEYSWRLVHFTDQELADLAYEEAERH